VKDVPMFLMAWMLPLGKMVILLGVRVVLTVRAPFSEIIYVSATPLTATT
jgi:hypothetical protein